jgi:hypothetical protein
MPKKSVCQFYTVTAGTENHAVPERPEFKNFKQVRAQREDMRCLLHEIKDRRGQAAVRCRKHFSDRNIYMCLTYLSCPMRPKLFLGGGLRSLLTTKLVATIQRCLVQSRKIRESKEQATCHVGEHSATWNSWKHPQYSTDCAHDTDQPVKSV